MKLSQSVDKLKTMRMCTAPAVWLSQVGPSPQTARMRAPHSPAGCIHLSACGDISVSLPCRLVGSRYRRRLLKGLCTGLGFRAGQRTEI